MSKNFVSFLDEVQALRFRLSLLEVWLREKSQFEYVNETGETKMCSVDETALKILSECQDKLFDEVYLPLKVSAQ